MQKKYKEQKKNKRPDGCSGRRLFSSCSLPTVPKGEISFKERKWPLYRMIGKSVDSVTRLWYRLRMVSFRERMLGTLRGRFLKLVTHNCRIREGRGREAEWKDKKRKT